MNGNSPRWLLLTFLFVLLIIPVSANAQGQVSLKSLSVQLWPEYDQPSVLVIYDFTLDEGISLPANVTLRIPADANLIAVAYAPSGSNLLNAPFEEPYIEGDWQVVTITVDTVATYHIEYYAPLVFDGSERMYEYIWPGDHAVDSFNLTVKVPVDTTEISTDPPMTESTSEDGSQVNLNWETSDLAANEQLPIEFVYTKTSDRLSMSGPLQPDPVDENTDGRVSLSNYLPYIMGGLGVLLIAGGGFYFWQSGRGKADSRKRHRSRARDDAGEEVYCHQCGKRAQASDRFCRTCGTRLRKET
jgi:hypothetical protein